MGRSGASTLFSTLIDFVVLARATSFLAPLPSLSFRSFTLPASLVVVVVLCCSSGGGGAARQPSMANHLVSISELFLALSPLLNLPLVALLVCASASSVASSSSATPCAVTATRRFSRRRPFSSTPNSTLLPRGPSLLSLPPSSHSSNQQCRRTTSLSPTSSPARSSRSRPSRRSSLRKPDSSRFDLNTTIRRTHSRDGRAVVATEVCSVSYRQRRRAEPAVGERRSAKLLTSILIPRLVPPRSLLECSTRARHDRYLRLGVQRYRTHRLSSPFRTFLPFAAPFLPSFTPLPLQCSLNFC